MAVSMCLALFTLSQAHQRYSVLAGIKREEWQNQDPGPRGGEVEQDFRHRHKRIKDKEKEREKK